MQTVTEIKNEIIEHLEAISKVATKCGMEGSVSIKVSGMFLCEFDKMLQEIKDMSRFESFNHYFQVTSALTVAILLD